MARRTDADVLREIHQRRNELLREQDAVLIVVLGLDGTESRWQFLVTSRHPDGSAATVKIKRNDEQKRT